MVALLLSALLTAGPVYDPLGPYRDRPVVSVHVQAPEGEQVAELVRLVGIAPGYLLTSAAVDAALKRLYALGRFSRVDLYAERVAGSVVLHFVLERVRHLASLEVSGLSFASRQAFVTSLRMPIGSELDRRTTDVIRERGRGYLGRVGLPRADLEVEQEPAPDGGMNLTVKVHEGEPRRITSVRFSGDTRVAPFVLARHVRAQAGAVLDLDDLERDRERLQHAYLERGFLAVRVQPPRVDGDDRAATVTFEVAAGPRIALYFQGNRALSDERLRALWPAGSGPMQLGDLEVFAQRITDAYRRLGYPHARVHARGFREDGRLERYVYFVHEGEPLTVKSIEFTGATVFPPELLSRQVQTVLAQELGPSGAVIPLSEADLAAVAGTRAPEAAAVVAPEQRWVPEIYDRVLDDLAAAYRDRGYLRVVVGPAQLVEQGRESHVIVPVVEGVQTRVSTLSFRDDLAFDGGDLYDSLLTLVEQRRHLGESQSHVPVPGAPLSSAGIEDARITLVRRYRDEGYLYARVFPEVQVTPEGTSADVVFRLEEGPQVRIDNLLIRGNRHTRARLVRDRMSLKEGELYRLDEALQDQRKIASLGVFSSVRVRLVDEETPSERKDVVAEVVERNRQAFELWPGVSTADGPRLRLDYSHLNLGGTATSFSASLKVNWKMFFQFYGEYATLLRERYASFSFRQKTEIQARAGVRSPRFGLGPVDAGLRVDSVGERSNAIPYSLDALRAIFGLDLFAIERLGLTVEPQFSLTSLRCFPSTSLITTSVDCQTQLINSTQDRRRIDEGLRAEFKLGPSLTLDLRDDPLNPRLGFFANTRVVYGVGATLPASALTTSDFGTNVPSNQWNGFDYVKGEAVLSGYVPLPGFVFGVTARGGTLLAGTAPPIDERYYLGGSTSMRGFQEAAMLPDDVCVIVRWHGNNGLPDPDPASLPRHCVWANRAYAVTQNGGFVLPLPNGGTNYLLFKAEARISLGQQFLLTVFTDVGNLWLTFPGWAGFRMRVNPGLGLRYATPAGPIGLDVGVLPDADVLRGERVVNLQLAIGVF